MLKNKKKKVEDEDLKIETISTSRSRRTPKPNPKYASDDAILSALKFSSKDIGSSTEDDDILDEDLDSLDKSLKIDKNRKRIIKKISETPKSEPVRKLRDRNSSNMSTDIKAKQFMGTKNLARSKLLYDLSSPGKDEDNDTDTENKNNKNVKNYDTYSDESSDETSLKIGRGRPRKSLLGIPPRETRQSKKNIHEDKSSNNNKKNVSLNNNDTITIVNVDDIINNRDVESAKQAAKKNLSNILERKRYFADSRNNNNASKKIKLDTDGQIVATQKRDDTKKTESEIKFTATVRGTTLKKPTIVHKSPVASKTPELLEKKENVGKPPEKRTYINKALNNVNKINRPDIKIEDMKVIQSSSNIIKREHITQRNISGMTTNAIKGVQSKLPQQPVRILNSTLKSRNMGSPTVKLSNSTSGKIYSIDLTETGEILVDDRAKKIIPVNKSNNNIILNSTLASNRNSLNNKIILPSNLKTTITKLSPVAKPPPAIARQVVMNKKVPMTLSKPVLAMKVGTPPSTKLMTSAPVKIVKRPEEKPTPKITTTTCVEKWSVLAIPPIIEINEKYTISFSLIKLGNDIKQIKLPSKDWHYKIFLQKLNNYTFKTETKKIAKDEEDYEDSDVEHSSEENKKQFHVSNKHSASRKDAEDIESEGAKSSTAITRKTAIKAENKMKSEVYTGEVQDVLIKESDKHNYEPNNISFRRSCKNAGAASNKRQIQYDRSVTFKNKSFYINIEGKNCKLIGCSGHINSLEDIEYLLDILDYVNLSHSCVEVCNVL